MTSGKYRYLAPSLVVLLAFASARAGEPGKVAAARSQVFQKIAAAGNRATVGIYCKRGEHEAFFGTGVVITAAGHILTSTTVVPQGASEIEIYFADHKMLMAEIVEINEKMESTLLKVEGKKLAYLPVAKEIPKVGERAYTFGNANNAIRLGAQASFSTGVVSGIYKVKSADSQSTYAGLAIETDAAINPGQDGGPLLNSRGQLAGIISLSFSDFRWQGVAVPFPLIRKELSAFKDKKIKLSTKTLLKPPLSDTALGNALAKRGRKIGAFLVSLKVERAYAPEKLPQLSWERYMRSLSSWAAMSDSQKQMIRREFALAERTFVANQQLRRPGGAVTGILISPDGHILTSLFNIAADEVFKHKQRGIKPVTYRGNLRQIVAFDKRQYQRVRNQVKSITVKLKDGRSFKAEILAKHIPLKIAILKISASGLPCLALKEYVAAPLLGIAVAAVGVIEGKARTTLNTGMISAEERTRGRQFQFDALINFGNSGGPVIDRQGNVIGIITSPMRPGPFMGRVLTLAALQRWRRAPNGGVSFATRTDKIIEALPGLLAGKTVEAVKGPYLGIVPDQKKQFSNQVVVGAVMKDSPAAKAGFKGNDEILKLDGKPMISWKEITAEVLKHKPGDTLIMTVRRKGSRRYLEINGKQVANARDLVDLFDSLDDGDEVKGRYVQDQKIFDLSLTLGERPR